jgi:membrane protein
MIVISAYVNADPRVAAARLIRRLDLTGATANLVRDVLGGAGIAKFTAALIAVVSVVVFGLGIGRTLQLVYARIWRIPEPQVGITENWRYFAWLTGLVVGTAIYVIELALLKDADKWVEWVSAPFWAAGIVAFLTWTPVLLLHKRITWRQALPGALVMTIGLLGVRLISSIVFANWLNWYAKYYGGIGIALALFFWLALATSVLIVGAAFAPAYGVRRQARLTARADAPGA